MDMCNSLEVERFTEIKMHHGSVVMILFTIIFSQIFDMVRFTQVYSKLSIKGKYNLLI